MRLLLLILIGLNLYGQATQIPASGGGGGSGTVTNTGTLTANKPVIGNGTTDIKVAASSGNTTTFATVTGAFTVGNAVTVDASGNFVDAGSPVSGGCTTSGSATQVLTDSGAGGCTSNAALVYSSGTVTLGTAGSVVGAVAFKNATSGTITVSPATGALGTTAITLPATAGTVAVVSGLTTTAFVTANGTTGLQTPSATSTLDSSGNGVFTGTVTATGFASGSGPPSVTAGTGGVDAYGEGTAPSAGCPATGVDCIYADSTQHRMMLSNNNVAASPVAVFSDKLSVFAATTSAELAGVLSDEVGSGKVAFATSTPFTTDIHAASAGGATVGTAALPFSSAYIGGSATNNFQITGTATAARVMTLPDVTSSTFVVAATSTTTTQALFATATAGAPAFRAIVAGDIPTLNQSTTGSAATLTTPRGVYGNNFDGSAALTQIIASTYGGTGNGFTKFSGPASSEKTFTLPNANATLTYTVASGTSALGTSAISSGACATLVTTSATGTASTDVVSVSFNSDITAVTGYVPSTSGMLTIYPYPTTDNVNFKVCNPTSSSITPGAVTLNWRVSR